MQQPPGFYRKCFTVLALSHVHPSSICLILLHVSEWVADTATLPSKCFRMRSLVTAHYLFMVLFFFFWGGIYIKWNAQIFSDYLVSSVSWIHLGNPDSHLKLLLSLKPFSLDRSGPGHFLRPFPTFWAPHIKILFSGTIPELLLVRLSAGREHHFVTWEVASESA